LLQRSSPDHALRDGRKEIGRHDTTKQVEKNDLWLTHPLGGINLSLKKRGREEGLGE